MGGRGVAAYLQAMLRTGALGRVAKGEVASPTMPHLLGTLRDRSAGEKRPSTPGELLSRPLHVTLVQPGALPWPLRFLIQARSALVCLVPRLFGLTRAYRWFSRCWCSGR